MIPAAEILPLFLCHVYFIQEPVIFLKKISKKGIDKNLTTAYNKIAEIYFYQKQRIQNEKKIFDNYFDSSSIIIRK